MHSGHSVYATVHADTVEETIQRLTNPPIEVPKNLLTAVNLNVVMFRDRRLGFRRAMQVGEFIPSMDEAGNSIKPNVIYRWKASNDTMVEHAAPVRLFAELSRVTGMSMDEINRDLQRKQKILNWMVKENINNVDAVGEIMREYYTDPNSVLKRAGANMDEQK